MVFATDRWRLPFWKGGSIFWDIVVCAAIISKYVLPNMKPFGLVKTPDRNTNPILTVHAIKKARAAFFAKSSLRIG